MLPPITVFDVETTGLDPRKGHRIVELAGVRMEGGRIAEDKTFSTFVNPERALDIGAQRVNGIMQEDIADAPTIMTVLPQFLDFAKGSILFAHNAAFDKSFLEAEKEFCWGYVELPEILCSMRLAQSLVRTTFGHSLDALSRHFGIPLPEGRHRALPDVIQTAKILLRMLDHGKISSMDELRRRAGLQQMAAK